MKPLFIPLKKEFFEAFERGDKDTEYRIYGARWNEKTCPIGRPATLAYGYTKRRLYGVVAGFVKSEEPTKSEAWKKCYGEKGKVAACIKIKLTTQHPGQESSPFPSSAA